MPWAWHISLLYYTGCELGPIFYFNLSDKEAVVSEGCVNEIGV